MFDEKCHVFGLFVFYKKSQQQNLSKADVLHLSAIG